VENGLGGGSVLRQGGGAPIAGDEVLAVLQLEEGKGKVRGTGEQREEGWGGAHRGGRVDRGAPSGSWRGGRAPISRADERQGAEVGALGVLLARKKVARGKIFGPVAAGAFLTVERCGAVGWAVWGWSHAVGLERGPGQRGVKTI
jgi:hypothetical protein